MSCFKEEQEVIVEGRTELVFDSYIDVQSRLVILPLSDEECVGAFISSYTPKRKVVIIKNDDSLVEDLEVNRSLEDEPYRIEEDKKQEDDDEDICISNINQTRDLTGYVLCGIVGNSDRNWKEEEYSCILGAIRDAPCPITIQIEPGRRKEEVVEKHPECETKPNNRDLLVGQLSKWGSRLRVTSAIIAAEATNLATASSFSMNSTPSRSPPRTLSPSRSPPKSPPTSAWLYIQTEEGSIPLRNDARITNCSVLQIRQNPDVFACQWCVDSIPIDSATYYSFQPSAIHIGKKIQCIINNSIIVTTAQPILEDSNLLTAAKTNMKNNTSFFGSLFDDSNELSYKLKIESHQLSFYPLSGETVNPLLFPITKDFSVSVDPCHPRVLLFMFSQQKKWKLLAPNRIARETILLSLKCIAKTDSSTLFKHQIQLDQTESIDLTSSLSEEADELDNDVVTKYQTQISTLQQNLHQLQSTLLQKEKSSLTLDDTYQSQTNKLKEENDQLSMSLKEKEKAMKDLEMKYQTQSSNLNQSSTLLKNSQKRVEELDMENRMLQASLNTNEENLKLMDGYKREIINLEKNNQKLDLLQNKLNEKQKQFDLLESLHNQQIKHQTEQQAEYQTLQQKYESLEQELSNSQTQYETLSKQLTSLQQNCSSLITEKNNYKHKSNSLSKEIHRLCKSRQDYNLKLEEEYQSQINSLISRQKEYRIELSQYKNLYEQSLQLQQKPTQNFDIQLLLQQRSEMERIVQDLTEHLNAKEMQLQTLKDINQILEKGFREKGDI